MSPEHSAPVIQPSELEPKENLADRAPPQERPAFEPGDTNRESTLDQPQSEYGSSRISTHDYWSLFYWLSGIAGLIIGAYTVSQASLVGSAESSVLLSIDGVGVMIFAALQILVGLLRRTQWLWRGLAERIIAGTDLLWGIIGILLGLFALGLAYEFSMALGAIIYLSTSWNILGCIGLGSIVLLYWYWNLHAPFQVSQWGRPAQRFPETILHYPGAYCIRCGMPLKRDDRFCSSCGSLKEF